MLVIKNVSNKQNSREEKVKIFINFPKSSFSSVIATINTMSSLVCIVPVHLDEFIKHTQA